MNDDGVTYDASNMHACMDAMVKSGQSASDRDSACFTPPVFRY
jgi:hypothetical protein